MLRQILLVGDPINGGLLVILLALEKEITRMSNCYMFSEKEILKRLWSLFMHLLFWWRTRQPTRSRVEHVLPLLCCGAFPFSVSLPHFNGLGWLSTPPSIPTKTSNNLQGRATLNFPFRQLERDFLPRKVWPVPFRWSIQALNPPHQKEKTSKICT